MENKHMKKLLMQIIKFGAVGFLCFFIEYFTLLALVELVHVPVLIASALAFAVSVTMNYILSITVVFDTDKNADKKKQFVVFIVLSLIGMGINQLVMWGGTSWLDQYMERSYMLVKIFATAVVMVYNFITRKIFIEKKPAK